MDRLDEFLRVQAAAKFLGDTLLIVRHVRPNPRLSFHGAVGGKKPTVAVIADAARQAIQVPVPQRNRVFS
jgi:hypothetical protein